MSTNHPESDGTDTLPTPNWSRISRHVVNSYVEANTAVLAAMGLATGDDADSTASASPDADRSAVSRSASDGSVVDLEAVGDSWRVERSVDAHEDLGVGEFVRFTKAIHDADVAAFARVSGDTNRLHLEPEFAADTRFGGRIAHGTLVAGTISAALARFPGVTIYLSQDLEFHAPVEIGAVVTAECEIVEHLGGDRYRLRTTVFGTDHTEADDTEPDDTGTDDTVVDGEAVVVISPAPSE